MTHGICKLKQYVKVDYLKVVKVVSFNVQQKNSMTTLQLYGLPQSFHDRSIQNIILVYTFFYKQTQISDLRRSCLVLFLISGSKLFSRLFIFILTRLLHTCSKIVVLPARFYFLFVRISLKDQIPQKTTLQIQICIKDNVFLVYSKHCLKELTFC